MQCNMERVLPFVGMVMVTLVQVSSMGITKEAMSKGLNKYVLFVYSTALSSLFFLLCSLTFHRSVRLPLSASLLGHLFLLSLMGSAAELCVYAGIQYSSPTLGTAMLNLNPAFTFILSLIFRLEKLDWRSRSSQAKSLGTIVSIAGAFVVTFYKGPVLSMLQSPAIFPTHQLFLSSQLNWILGGFFLAAGAFMTSAWYTLQTLVLKKFPAVFTVMFYLSSLSTILSAAYSVIVVKEAGAWKLSLDIGLVAILYSAIVLNGLCMSLCSWCLSRIGPLCVSMFKPLGIFFALVMGILFLGDALFLGSLIGAAIIVCGFYAVMWGKAKEDIVVAIDAKMSSEKLPLLQNSEEETGSFV